ncbi:MAG: SIMPL domain-containing protein [Bacteroidota bacterium]
MKKLFFALVCITFAYSTLQAQAPLYSKPIIEVTGSAEMEIIPDEVYVSVTLREFIEERKKQTIDGIEKDFRSVLSKLNIDAKQLSLENVYGNYDYDYKTNKRGEFLNAKVYIIKFNNLEKYNQLVMSLDKKGIESVHIQRTGHSKMEEYRRQVKIDALKAAKEKAEQMLQSINKKAGDIMLVRERDNNMGYYQPMLYRSNKAGMAMESDQSAQEPIEMQKLKIRYEVEAHFVIQ